jgi:hypothetical protein
MMAMRADVDPVNDSAASDATTAKVRVDVAVRPFCKKTKPPRWRRGGGENGAFNFCSASALKFKLAELLLAVLFGVSHHRVFSVPSCVNRVASRGVGMMCRLFVVSGVVMLGRFSVVAGGMRKMF